MQTSEAGLGGKDTVGKKKRKTKKTWNEAVEKILINKGITWNEAKKLTPNKKEWNKFAHS